MLEPEEPELPDEPAAPLAPEEPELPDEPAAPDCPEDPEEPVLPEDPEEPEDPDEPEGPTMTREMVGLVNVLSPDPPRYVNELKIASVLVGVVLLARVV